MRSLVPVLALLYATCGEPPPAHVAEPAVEPIICGWIYSLTAPPTPVYGLCTTPAGTQEVIQNGGFETWPLGAAGAPAWWTLAAGPTWGTTASQTVEAFQGAFGVKFLETGGATVLRSTAFPALPGHRPFVYVKWSQVASTNLRVSVKWFDGYDGAGTGLGETVVVAPAADTAWHRVEVGPTATGARSGVMDIGTFAAASSAYAVVDAAGVLAP